MQQRAGSGGAAVPGGGPPCPPPPRRRPAAAAGGPGPHPVRGEQQDVRGGRRQAAGGGGGGGGGGPPPRARQVRSGAHRIGLECGSSPECCCGLALMHLCAAVRVLSRCGAQQDLLHGPHGEPPTAPAGRPFPCRACRCCARAAAQAAHPHVRHHRRVQARGGGQCGDLRGPAHAAAPRPGLGCAQLAACISCGVACGMHTLCAAALHVEDWCRSAGGTPDTLHAFLPCTDLSAAASRWP